ncbi:uncharacterized protein BT62DRAFT_1001658 [Guyanagaster necrorhizus]|uniref:UvrD-like helicase ATP-binding domain-containing protein n=1 Tax=Guyanagaster necrorhizus TaxID=856835 RepID=A0A9P8AWR1_9AGAR|nr:uncharacterized protein BT62DRAFT_1001658 [Guyanagaster necrorhizus MCA 3950]KAG7450843.1 hypothetical protein BT62DRAFT_1001658 [Guyanagaster necrorhizus MCA 3950]
MSPKQRYRSDLFSPEKFASAHLLDSALEELKGILTKHNFKHVFQDLLDNESPRVLLLVLSCSYIFTALSETTPLISWLLESFPSEPANYDATVHYNIISRISTELISSSLIKEKEPCARYHEIAQIAPKVLKSLVSFLGRIGSEHYEGKAHMSKFQQTKEDGPFAFVKKDFDILKIDIPETSSETSVSMDHVLQSQKDTLKFYLELLRRPEIYVSLKEHCIVSEEERIAPGPVVEPPSAYPIVQPMKALYFDTTDGFGKWTVIISTNADNFLRRTHKKDLYTFNITVKKIKELSCGHFTVNNQKRLSGRATEVPIFMAKVTCNLRLIVGHLFLIPDIADATLQYQIDTIPGDEKREQQALKIFGIYTHAQIDNRLWSSISSQLRKKGEEYRKRCAVRMPADSQASKNIFIPAFFPPLPEVLPSEIEGIPDLRPDETVEVHSRLLFEKYVTFSQPFLNTILADVNVIFPHTVSMQETRIIEHPKSCYVIGRSGTGKTTTILFKMLLIEQTFRLMESGLPRPRQVFVTKSRMLAKKVQEDFSNLASSLAIASRPSADLMNLSRAQYQDDIGLIDIDDIVDWRTDLPAKYSELEERHFPLFITFDGLCEMLEADMGAQTSTSIERNKSHMSVITLESFFEYYWSYFPEPLVKGLDPTLVFSQIIGVIKGSKETLSEEKRHLSRATYLDLSKRQQSTFADRRGEVYKLFELYMHKKKVRGDYDTADRTHNILKYFTEQGIPGQGLDHLYVDEVQDNMLIDTMVLRALCSNADGLFWAGDTAQTISVGSAFRFNGLKAFQWEIEDQYQRKRGLGAGKTKGPPETFQLAVNYRTHAGIVNFAHSVIDLITVFWKDSIDRLSPEISSVDGTKPVFFKTEDSTQLAQFILGDVGKYIEFGAQQCIIVRNETARERFRQQVGEVGLVLTIYESKGLEFNDVLLYDFFADSLAGPAQWRVVLNAIEETNEDPKNLPPRFDSIRHASICDEVSMNYSVSWIGDQSNNTLQLKFLYVAITRARENIWIVDGSETGEPMRVGCYSSVQTAAALFLSPIIKIFWMRKDLIQNYTLGSYTSQLASSSTSEKWASRGRELFYRKQFSDAKHCYIRANLPILASIAGAYDLRVKARKVIEAAISFSECATITSSSKASLMYFRISGECFEQADQKCRAAKMFFQAQEYNHSTELYRDLGKFDEAVAIVKAHGDEMSSKVVKNVIELARLTYFSNRQMKKAHELFDSPEEELEYLEERDLDIALADLLETMGRCSEAAELHYFEGRREEAIDLFLREAENKSALRRAQECILEELWHRISFGADSRAICSDLGVSRLMRFASRFDTALMGKTEAAELFMFTAIMQDDVSRLRELALEFHKVGHSSATLLCLDQYFSRAPRIQDLALVDAIEELSMFYTYVDLLSATAFRTDPCGDVATATLFGFRRIAENEFLVPQNTWLYRSVDLRPRNVIRDSDLNLRLSVPELRELFQDALRSRLKQRTATENDECARSKAFMPCLVFAVSGFCRRPKCPEAHVSPLEITPGYYNMRVRLHLQQILILQSLRENAHADVEHRGTKFWLNRLYEALYPPHHVFGSISDLALSTIPEAAKALNVMKDWVRTLVYSQVYTPQTTFLTDVMRATTLTFMFDRSQADYLRNAAYFSTRPPLVYIRRGGSPILPELLGAMSGTHTWSLAAGFAFVEQVLFLIHLYLCVLCDLVDFLCSSVILCGRRPGMTVMHDVTVPRSWLLRFIKHDSLYLNPEIQTNTFHLLLTPMRDLLEQLYDGNGSEYLLYGPTRNLSNVPAVIRDVYMTRICKAIGLLGYNIRSDILRNNIRKLLLSLRREGCLLPSFYSRYVDAASDSWAELAKAIRLSLQYDTMDEMIHLVHKSQVPARDCALIGVRQVVYDNLMEIQELLDPNSSVYSQSESLIEVSTQLALDDQADEMECPLYAESVRDEEDSVDEIDDTIVAIPIQDMPRLEPSTEETAAASLIQRVYRKVLRHRRGIAKSGMAGLRAQIYASCTKEVPRLGDNPGLYLRFFLGPLPHILACLEIVRIDSLNQKQKTKKRFLDCSLDELDALDGLLMQIKYALPLLRAITDTIDIFNSKASKAAVILQKQLSPSSAFHERCDGKELEQLVEEVKVLVSSLSFKTSSNLSDDLHLAIKGISTARSSTGARKEPTLKIRR